LIRETVVKTNIARCRDILWTMCVKNETSIWRNLGRASVYSPVCGMATSDHVPYLKQSKYAVFKT